MLSALHFLTHIGLSWILASLWPASRRDRWLIVLAGTALDLDGAGIVWSQAAYLSAHRAAGHSLVFGLLLLASWSVARPAALPPHRDTSTASAASTRHTRRGKAATSSASLRTGSVFT
jgi:hypothetical protein